MTEVRGKTEQPRNQSAVNYQGQQELVWTASYTSKRDAVRVLLIVNYSAVAKQYLSLWIVNLN